MNACDESTSAEAVPISMAFRYTAILSASGSTCETLSTGQLPHPTVPAPESGEFYYRNNIGIDIPANCPLQTCCIELHK
jgi:hypothetical protein